MRALLHFHFREEHRRSDRGDRDLAAFRAANAVENVLMVAGRENAGQSGERGADDVHAAD